MFKWLWTRYDLNKILYLSFYMVWRSGEYCPQGKDKVTFYAFNGPKPTRPSALRKSGRTVSSNEPNTCVTNDRKVAWHLGLTALIGSLPPEGWLSQLLWLNRHFDKKDGGRVKCSGPLSHEFDVLLNKYPYFLKLKMIVQKRQTLFHHLSRTGPLIIFILLDLHFCLAKFLSLCFGQGCMQTSSKALPHLVLSWRLTLMDGNPD